MFGLHIPSFHFNSNLIILAALVALPIFGVMLGEGRLRRMTLAVFVGLVLAQTFTDIAFRWLSHWHLTLATKPNIALAIFGLSVVLLNLGPISKHGTLHRFSWRVIILSLLASALLVSNLLLFLPPATQAKLLHESQILTWLNQTRIIWMAAAVLWVVFLNLTPGKEHGKKGH